jgi:hypothetical protein
MMMRTIGLVAVLLVAGCGIEPPKGATCFVETFTLHVDEPRPVNMVVVNDGRTCDFTAHMVFGETSLPLSSGRVAMAPKAGTAELIDAGGTTVVAYRPRAGFAGSDSFSVSLGQPAIGLPVAVEVRAPPSVPTAPAADAAVAAKGTLEAPYRVPVTEALGEGNSVR